MVESNELPGVAIIGCGLIGRKRALSLEGARVAACADLQEERARRLAAESGAPLVFHDWREAVKHPSVQIVFVSTINDSLAEITLGAVQAGKHVLVEKPAGRSVRELDPVVDAAEKNKVKVRVGFNHRYHPALLKAREWVESGVVGELMFVRGRYGHGARVGYDREWRMNPQVSGGGELIDQGVHLIDLSRMLLGDFPGVEGLATTLFWDTKADDNAFMTLRTDKGQVAFLHVSCTEWKNLFSYEIYGRTGKIHVEGLGGSYGVERVTLYKMLPKMGPPDMQSFEFPHGDEAWKVEVREFLKDIREDRAVSPGIRDAVEALKIVESITEQSKKGH
jgi:predicted dehydrogenase